ncbi:MAG: AAA family ATPase [Spirochaetia bacterium]|nr:AAA family ATPase [Spirochaetia bacterium]
MKTDELKPERILPYIPDRILYRLKESGRSLYRTEKLSGAILFFDIAGFTTLTETLAKAHTDTDRSAEIMQEILTEYYTNLLNVVRSFGGFTYQFAGDSVLVALLQNQNETSQECALRAALCAVKTQDVIQKINEEKSENEIQVFLKISISIGDFHQITLGSIKRFLSASIIGPPVEEALLGENLANKNEIIVSTTVWNFLPDTKTGEAIDNYFRLIHPGISREYNFDQSIYDITSNSRKLARSSARFLPPILLNKINNATQNFIGDFREVTSVFVGIAKNNLSEDIAQVANLWNDFFDFLQECSETFGGTLVQTDFSDKGNVFLILFGAPQAMENKEIMASEFALKVIDNVNSYPGIKNLRIGISTGKSFCGDLGAEFRKGYTLVSNFINLASRLMTYGEDQTIHIDITTRNKLPSNFELKSINDVSLKGMELKVNFYKLIGKDQSKKEYNEFFSTPMIGRKTELQKIHDICFESLNNKTKILSIAGEAGVGKSRLISSFLKNLPDKNIKVITTSCFPYEKNTPFYIWREIISLVFNLGENDSVDQKLLSIKSVLKQLNDVDEQWANAVAIMASINVEEESLTKNLELLQKKERLSQILLEVIKFISNLQPLLVVIEDIHWVDEASFNLLEYIFTHLKNHPVLFFLVSRPWKELEILNSKSNYTNIALNELPKDEAIELIRIRLNLKEQNNSIEEKIMVNSHGNPFFIESIVYSLKENGVIVAAENGKNEINQSVESLTIPNSLQDVVLSRIDRLSEDEQALLKIASVIGRIFMFKLLHKMNPALTKNSVEAVVRVLENLELTPVESTSPLSYIFKHAIIRDVAYNSLLLSTRRNLHSQLADIMENEYKNNLIENAETLAFHFSEGGQNEKAFHYTLIAAQKAAEKYANKDALHYYSRALDLLDDYRGKNINKAYEIRKEMAIVNRNLGNFQDSRDLYAICLAYYKDPINLAEMKFGIGRSYQEQGDILNAIHNLEAALKYLGTKTPVSKGATIRGLLRQMVIRGFHNAFPFAIRKTQRKQQKYKLQSRILMTLQKIYFLKSVEHVAWASYAHVNLTERMNDDWDLSLGYSYYATIIQSIGFIKSARIYFDRALKILEKTNMLYPQGLTYQRLGVHGTYINNPDFVIEMEEKSIKTLSQIGELWDMMMSHIVLAIGHYYKGNLRKACEGLIEMEKSAREVNSKMYIGWSTGRKAYNQYLMGEVTYPQIKDILNQGEQIAIDVRDMAGLSAVLMFHTKILLLEGNTEEALLMAEKELAAITEYGVKLPHVHYGLVATIEAAAANINSTNNEIIKRSKNLFNSSYRTLKKSAKAFPYIKGPTYRALAVYHEACGNHAQAISEIKKSISVLKNGPNKLEYGWALQDAARILNDSSIKEHAEKKLGECEVFLQKS